MNWVTNRGDGRDEQGFGCRVVNTGTEITRRHGLRNRQEMVEQVWFGITWDDRNGRARGS